MQTITDALADTFEPDADASAVSEFDALTGGDLATRVVLRVARAGAEILEVRSTDWRLAGEVTVGGHGTSYDRTRYTHTRYDRTVAVNAGIMVAGRLVQFLVEVRAFRYGANGRIRVGSEPVRIGIVNPSARVPDFSTATVEHIMVRNALWAA